MRLASSSASAAASPVSVGAVSADLDLALRLADAADAISLPRFRTGLAIETKADLTPVTEADRAVEGELRRLLADERPDDAILGEEDGRSRHAARGAGSSTRSTARGTTLAASPCGRR